MAKANALIYGNTGYHPHVEIKSVPSAGSQIFWIDEEKLESGFNY